MNLTKYINTAKNNPLSVPWKIFNIVRRKFPIDYWFFNGWSFPPEMITFLITRKCNFSCAGCSSASPEYTKKFKGQELNTNDFKKIIDKVSWFKPGIYFCGGEPTLREDLYELIKYAKNKGMVTAFTTNGSLLTKENINKIIESGVDFVSASLDGGQEHHNSYRGNKLAYQKLTAGIKELVNKRNSLNLKSPNIRITCIINPEDTKDALFVLDKAKEIGADEVAFGNLMFFPNNYREKLKKFIDKFKTGGPNMIGLEIFNNKLPFNLDPNLKTVYQDLIKRANLPVVFVPQKVDLEKFYSFQDPALDSLCLSPWFIATIFPDGKLSSCQEYFLGDLRNNSFLKLWNNKKMREFRKLRKKRTFPACFRCIEGHEIKFK